MKPAKDRGDNVPHVDRVVPWDAVQPERKRKKYQQVDGCAGVAEPRRPAANGRTERGSNRTDHAQRHIALVAEDKDVHLATNPNRLMLCEGHLGLVIDLDRLLLTSQVRVSNKLAVATCLEKHT